MDSDQTQTQEVETVPAQETATDAPVSTFEQTGGEVADTSPEATTDEPAQEGEASGDEGNAAGDTPAEQVTPDGEAETAEDSPTTEADADNEAAPTEVAAE